jgi:hypothetical protein
LSIHKESKAFLEGYEGPTYPTAIDDLNAIYYAIWDEKSGLKKILWIIKEVVGSIECFQERIHALLTHDKHIWLEGLRFLTSSGEVMVLLPRPRNWLRRSIAIYTKGIVSADEITTLIERVELRFYKIREKQVKEQLQEIINPE